MIGNRRRMDTEINKLERDIIQLIKDSEDTKEKAFLLVLLALTDVSTFNINSIDAITEKLTEMTISMEKRIKVEEALLNRGKGWRDVIFWALGTFQAIFVYLAIDMKKDLEFIKKTEQSYALILSDHIAHSANSAHDVSINNGLIKNIGKE